MLKWKGFRGGVDQAKGTDHSIIEMEVPAIALDMVHDRIPAPIELKLKQYVQKWGFEYLSYREDAGRDSFFVQVRRSA